MDYDNNKTMTRNQYVVRFTDLDQLMMRRDRNGDAAIRVFKSHEEAQLVARLQLTPATVEVLHLIIE